MSDHTPGPWRVTQEWSTTKLTKKYGVEAPTREGPGWPTPSATGFYAIALPPPHGHDPESRAIQKANAHLIAAAPDMLLALERLEGMLLDGPKLEIVRAAIAKATGGDT